MIAGVVLAICLSADAPRPKLAVLPLSAGQIAPETARILDDLLTSSIYRLKAYDVVNSADINALLGLDKMKDALGCNDVSCAAEIGGALGVDLLVSGSIGKLGGELIVTLTLLDAKQHRPAVRAQKRVVDRESFYARGVEEAVAELFAPLGVSAPAASAAPTPAPGTRWGAPRPRPLLKPGEVATATANVARARMLGWAIATMALGVPAIAGGVLCVALAPNRASVTNNEYAGYLEGLVPYSAVQAKIIQHNLLIGGGSVLIVGGALLAGTSILLFALRPKAPVAFVPMLGGGSVVGTW